MFGQGIAYFDGNFGSLIFQEIVVLLVVVGGYFAIAKANLQKPFTRRKGTDGDGTGSDGAATPSDSAHEFNSLCNLADEFHWPVQNRFHISKTFKTAFFSAFAFGLIVHLYAFTNFFINTDSVEKVNSLNSPILILDILGLGDGRWKRYPDSVGPMKCRLCLACCPFWPWRPALG